MISPRTLPLLAAVLLVAGGGFFLLEKAERQARDTTRKHHLEDIEQSLYFAQRLHGTYPPYEEPTWCGFLNAEENRAVRDQMEAALRQQHEKYKNVDKPYPSDPIATQDYFYWKRSPSMFELYAVLENEKTGDRSSAGCPTVPRQEFDYGLASILRQQEGVVTERSL
ncbi:MAG: hypothetical protein HYR90_00610 [Candidatus Andersenbacteria bacterium]|nr:hypothetical protein [Candidatus Andersenbacteria bacterium]MBI3251248.1 hypothetical protein [Candidatus Andersenbacteria bacterium]